MSRWLLIAAAIMVPVAPALTLAQGQVKGKPQAAQVKLWAAISVQNPVFPKIRANDLAITFAIVNDGRTPVNPGIGSSRLFINGVELHDWHMIVTNGPCTSFCEALPPGRTLLFSKGLGTYFQKPGVYTVRWEFQNFRTFDLTLRVLPGDL
jgi:hypothetical protein